MTLAEKITQLRKATGISQEQLAGALDVSRQSVSKWERGEAAPDIDKIVALGRYFSVSCDELLLDESPSGQKAPAPEGEPQREKPPAAQSGVGLGWAVRQNTALWQAKTAMQLARVTVALIVLCCLLPYGMQAFERYVFGQFYTHAVTYLGSFPMPPLLLLTAAFAGATIYFAVKAGGVLGKEKQPHTEETFPIE